MPSSAGRSRARRALLKPAPVQVRTAPQVLISDIEMGAAMEDLTIDLSAPSKDQLARVRAMAHYKRAVAAEATRDAEALEGLLAIYDGKP